MSINKDIKKEIITKFASNPNDTGSAQVQIAVLTKRIILLNILKIISMIIIQKEGL